MFTKGYYIIKINNLKTISLSTNLCMFSDDDGSLLFNDSVQLSCINALYSDLVFSILYFNVYRFKILHYIYDMILLFVKHFVIFMSLKGAI